MTDINENLSETSYKMELRTVTEPFVTESEKDSLTPVEDVTETDFLAQDVNRKFCLYFFLFFAIGLVNNTGYVLVGTTAKQLAKNFDVPALMACFQFCLIICNGGVRIFVAKFLIRIKHNIRIYANTILMLGGYALIAIVCNFTSIVAFVFSLVASIILGINLSFGESTNLGYLKGFPKRLVVGYSSGTGFAGVFGAGIPVLLQSQGITLFWIYIGTMPLAFLYAFCFYYVNRRKGRFQKLEKKFEEEKRTATRKLTNEEETQRKEAIRTSFGNAKDAEVVDEASSNLQINCVNMKLVMGKTYWLCLNLGMVYLMEYLIITSMTERTIKKLEYEYPEDNPPAYKEYAFAITCLCYQIGVFISRSSLYLFKIKYIEIMTILQILNWLLWLFEAIFLYCQTYWVFFVHLIFVGLMGGGSYVNILYQLMKKPELKQNEKELAVVLCTFCNDIGILIAAILSLIFANTFLYVPE